MPEWMLPSWRKIAGSAEKAVEGVDTPPTENKP